MSRVILMQGMPGCGKTTWAKAYQKEHQNTKRVNRDDLRSMIDDGQWSKSNEKFIKEIRNGIIQEALLQGHDIIVDDTNLDPSNEIEIIALVQDLESYLDETPVFEIKTFDTSVEECIKRDQMRSGRAKVGEEVILKFYNKYVSSKTKN